MNRVEMVSRLAGRTEPWDMVVIGGGATGVGVAVDAASRGYDVVLLEHRAAAPSSYTAACATSSKATSRW